jgi:hypothetical protein
MANDDSVDDKNPRSYTTKNSISVSVLISIIWLEWKAWAKKVNTVHTIYIYIYNLTSIILISRITRWQKCSAWFQSTTISTKWRHSPSRQLKLSPKLQMDPDYEHKLAWSHHPSLWTGVIPIELFFSPKPLKPLFTRGWLVCLFFGFSCQN